MPKYTVTVCAMVPAYADIVVEAPNADAAKATGDRICRRGWKAPEIEVDEFAPEWDSMSGFAVSYVEEKQSTAGDAAPLTPPAAAA